MHKTRTSFQPKDELIVQRYAGGVRLLHPRAGQHNPAIAPRVHELLKLPFNFYFMDCNSMLQKLNEPTAASCGYISKMDAVGRSIREISKKSTALAILQNDQNVVRSRKLKITDESYTRLDDSDVTAISIKFPLFGDQHQVLGILGCSIVMNQDGATSLTNALSSLIQTGLLGPSLRPANALLPGLQCGDLYLDRRDRDILFLLTRGKTAKETAKILHLSHRTIEHRLEKIKRKFKVASKSELIDRVLDLF